MKKRSSWTLPRINPNGPLDAALLLSRTGTLLAAWTKKAAPLDVLAVMAATMLASIDTLVEAVGDRNPRIVLVETDGRRITITRSDPAVFLVLMAPAIMGLTWMRREAERIVRGVSEQGVGKRTEGAAASPAPASRERPKARARVR